MERFNTTIQDQEKKEKIICRLHGLESKAIRERRENGSDDRHLISLLQTVGILLIENRVHVFPGINVVKRKHPGTVPEFLSPVIAFHNERQVQSMIIGNPVLISF